MLLRNLDQSAGLCNGTRLIITRMGRYVLEGKVITGGNIGEKVYIPRLSLTPSDTRLPFKFLRRQFPISVCFAITATRFKDSHSNKLVYTFYNPYSLMVNIMLQYQGLYQGVV